MNNFIHPDFIINKYYYWYFSIINNALNREAIADEYYEKHHIIPKSLGGSNFNSNRVKLKAKEHFVCHHLLTKFVTNKSKYSMFYAFNCMVFLENKQQKRHKVSLNQYEYAKRLNAEATSFTHKNRIFSEAYKQKIRDGLSIGTFTTPWGNFVSATQAGILCPTGKLSPHAILRYCKNNMKRLSNKTIVQSKFFTSDDEGYTFNELGFSFISR